jgi:hypothetical protein
MIMAHHFRAMAARDVSLKNLRSMPRALADASPAPILSFNTARGVTVSVTGIADATLVARITSAAKHSLKHVVGKWTLSLAPSGYRGEWRMQLRGTSGVHLWLFCSRPEALPDGTADKLSAFLKQAAASRR